MLITNSEFSASVEAAVSQLEKSTDVEVVVVAAARSGSYRDIATMVGVGVSWGVLWGVLFIPRNFPPEWVPLELLIIAITAGWASHRSTRLMRLFSSAKRRKKQTNMAAHAAFFEESVHCTRGRTGLLIYMSALEDHVILIPDTGVNALIPRGKWNAIRWGKHTDPTAPGDLPHFIEGLRSVGKILAEHIPSTEDNPNELSDAPRIRT